MRKRTCRHTSLYDDDDDMFPDFDYDEGITGSDTDISECSEFDVISQHVLQDEDLIGEFTGSKSLSICSSPCPSEDEGILVTKLSAETQDSILSPEEVNEENVGTVRSKEDQVLSFVTASPNELRNIVDPRIFPGHENSERKKNEVSCLCSSINKEDPEISCHSDVFTNDGDTPPATEVRYGDIANMQGSMEEMISNDNLILVNKNDEPIPISSVPPDGGSSSILPETFTLHQTFRCNECNGHDDEIGLEISPIPVTKTLEGPSRPWSVCSSLAAVRNIPLLEDSSGARSSLDEQLYVNVSSSEGRDAQLSQTPSTLYQEDEIDGEDELSFSDIDAMIRKLNLIPDDSDLCLNKEDWNMSTHQRHTLLGLEHCSRTSIRRGIMSQGAIAVLHSRDSKHFIRKHEVIIGRSYGGINVDIDLGKYGYGRKISRRQALVKLENNGSFSLKNLGKRHMLVNGEKLNTGQIVSLTSSSSVDIRGILLVFKINREAVRQFLKNSTLGISEDDTKFRWCE
ncbi:uncharacterized protein LOC18018501 isoform X2 [Eutrema salsugineum]|nr:uncharacterized protein LOC18018501 isoform X2 [Eutrema salsugineum]